eukprot:maker-scaffold25_size650667-snap-gene-4.14 protein:Tk06708 transcript:maker-scaffold25_size650667-snap-gene-4.14-mRNA-1 annotation:"myosin-m heavy chain-like"
MEHLGILTGITLSPEGRQIDTHDLPLTPQYPAPVPANKSPKKKLVEKLGKTLDKIAGGSSPQSANKSGEVQTYSNWKNIGSGNLQYGGNSVKPQPIYGTTRQSRLAATTALLYPPWEQYGGTVPPQGYVDPYQYVKNSSKCSCATSSRSKNGTVRGLKLPKKRCLHCTQQRSFNNFFPRKEGVVVSAARPVVPQKQANNLPQLNKLIAHVGVVAQDPYENVVRRQSLPDVSESEWYSYWVDGDDEEEQAEVIPRDKGPTSAGSSAKHDKEEELTASIEASGRKSILDAGVDPYVLNGAEEESEEEPEEVVVEVEVVQPEEELPDDPKEETVLEVSFDEVTVDECEDSAVETGKGEDAKEDEEEAVSEKISRTSPGRKFHKSSNYLRRRARVQIDHVIPEEDEVAIEAANIEIVSEPLAGSRPLVSILRAPPALPMGNVPPNAQGEAAASGQKSVHFSHYDHLIQDGEMWHNSHGVGPPSAQPGSLHSSSEDEWTGYDKVIVSHNLAEEILDEIYGKIEPLAKASADKSENLSNSQEPMAAKSDSEDPRHLSSSSEESSNYYEDFQTAPTIELVKKSLADEILDELYGKTTAASDVEYELVGRRSNPSSLPNSPDLAHSSFRRARYHPTSSPSLVSPRASIRSKDDLDLPNAKAVVELSHRLFQGGSLNASKLNPELLSSILSESARLKLKSRPPLANVFSHEAPSLGEAKRIRFLSARPKSPPPPPPPVAEVLRPVVPPKKFYPTENQLVDEDDDVDCFSSDEFSDDDEFVDTTITETRISAVEPPSVDNLYDVAEYVEGKDEHASASDSAISSQEVSSGHSSSNAESSSSSTTSSDDMNDQMTRTRHNGASSFMASNLSHSASSPAWFDIQEEEDDTMSQASSKDSNDVSSMSDDPVKPPRLKKLARLQKEQKQKERLLNELKSHAKLRHGGSSDSELLKQADPHIERSVSRSRIDRSSFYVAESVYEEAGSRQSSPLSDHIYEEIPERSESLQPLQRPLPPIPELSSLTAAKTSAEDKKNPGGSIFEGASKYEILHYLRDAKDRIGHRDFEIDIEEKEESVLDPITGFLGKRNHTHRVSGISNSSSSSGSSVESSIGSSCETLMLRGPAERLLGTSVGVERNDSGVGSEASCERKPSFESRRAFVRANYHRKCRSQDDILLLSEDGIGLDVSEQHASTRCFDCDILLEVLDDKLAHDRVSGRVCGNCTKRRTERKEIITEIIETEVKYGRDLRIILEEFYRPMLVAGLLTSDQLAGIFLNTEELIQVNSCFTGMLKTAIDTSLEQNDEDLCCVNAGKIFLDALFMLRAYESYCTRQATASNLLATLEKERELLKIFLKVSQLENSTLRRMNLSSFLMVPVQRVTKYPLLLSRLLKVTPTHHKDRNTIKHAKEKIEAALEQMNKDAKDINSSKLWRRLPLKSSSSPSKKSVSNLDLSNADEVESEKMQRLATEVLSWSSEDSHFPLEGSLHFFQPSESTWKDSVGTTKFTLVSGVLVVQASEDLPEITDSKELIFPSDTTSIKDASLVLFKDKNSKPNLFREPLPLERCIVCCEPDWEDFFEIQEFVNKETFVFKGEDPESTKMWFKTLQFYTQCLGGWRKRRKGLGNIMVDPNYAPSQTTGAAGETDAAASAAP